MDTSVPSSSAPPRKKMPAEVFVKIWSNRMIVNELANWKDWVVFDKYKGVRRGFFYNIEITGDIIVEKAEIPLFHLVFSNCYLPKCELMNVNASTIVIQQNSTVGGLKIQDSAIGDITIEESETGDFEVATSHIGRFRIKNSIVADFLIVAGSVAEGFEVRDTITGNFLIKKNSVTRGFWFERSKIGLFKFENSKGTILSFRYECKVSKIYVWNGSLQRIQIRNNSFVGHLRLQINFQEPAHVIFEHSTLGFLDFENIVIPEFTTFNITDSATNYLYVNNFCNYGTVFYSNLSPLKTWIDFVKNEDGVPILSEKKHQFESLVKKSTLRFQDSDLGKFQFINTDLRQFDHFEFSNTKMLDAFVAGSQMPNDKNFRLPNDDKDPLKIAEQKRLAYGQFKKIYETRGDLAGSLRYLSYEMRAYRELIRHRIKKHRVFSKQWFDYFGELSILWFNQVSTNYGNNWLRGLGVTLLVMSICFTIFCLMLGYRPGNDWEKFGELVSYAPYYLNPLRDLDSVSMINENKEVPIEWYARLWDFISRIIVAYFAYQTIQAFRKLGKSSG